MKFICLTLRYPRDSGGENLIYVDADSILAVAVNMTDHGIVGAVVYTANPVGFHVAEAAESIYNLIREAKR